MACIDRSAVQTWRKIKRHVSHEPPSPTEKNLPESSLSPPTPSKSPVQDRRTSVQSLPPYQEIESTPKRRSGQFSLLNPSPVVVPDRPAEKPLQTKPSDPLGLTLIYDPGSPPSIDIIFVHGLGGTSRQTWSRNKSPDLFWPHKWLPIEPEIQTARILSFGYNASFSATGPPSLASISDFAKDLLYGMKFGKDDAMKELGIGKRPVIFVVHSMGGLVVKKV
ncbi:MAG: hypothetical protein Q9213_006075 [Squamulea squamosa]